MRHHSSHHHRERDRDHDRHPEARYGHAPFGRERHEHGPGRRGRGGIGRMFDHGDLRYLILQLIAEKPRHGYEIIKAIEEKLAGAYSPSPGVVYPTLTLLEELGHSTTTPGEGARKLHAITPEGQAQLDANRATLDAIMARIAQVNAAYGEGPAPQLLRAMENLKLALRMRLGRGQLTEDQVRAAAAAIDAAATTIEHL